MTMTDKEIAKAMRRCIHSECFHCPLCEASSVNDGLCCWRPKLWNEAADAIERLTDEAERLPLEQKWISVTDRFPDEGSEVLIYAVAKANGCAKGDRVTIAKWDRTYLMQDIYGELRWHVWQYFDYDYEVTHWMPLPEPPCAENGGKKR